MLQERPVEIFNKGARQIDGFLSLAKSRKWWGIKLDDKKLNFQVDVK